ncbi:MAG: hypothetical protein AAFZ18_03955 [Myxococcota bacterium]
MKHLSQVLLLSTLLGGCAEEFEPYSRITGFRVLAVRAEPPSPLPGQTAVFDVLVAGAPAEDVRFQWSWCPVLGGADRDFDCLVTPEDLGLSSDLGRRPTASFSFDGSAAQLQSLCRQLQASPLALFAEVPDCEQGIEISIILEAEASDRRIRSVKSLELLFGLEDQVPNQNPVVDAIVLPSGAVDRDTEVQLSASIPESESETYFGVPRSDPGGDPREVREQLFFSWFTTGGGFDPERRSFIPGETTFSTAAATALEVPLQADFPASTLGLYLVVRDDRGGVSWTDALMQVRP